MTKQCNRIIETLLYTTCNAAHKNNYTNGMFTNKIDHLTMQSLENGHWYNNQHISNNLIHVDSFYQQVAIKKTYMYSGLNSGRIKLQRLFRIISCEHMKLKSTPSVLWRCWFGTKYIKWLSFLLQYAEINNINKINIYNNILP